MKKIILALLIVHCSLLIADAQWIKQFSPDHDLNDIEFINHYTGWTCGSNNIYKTTNGGSNWIEQSHPDGYLIQQIHPVNENVVYAAGWFNFMKTTNGGENWFSLFDGIPPSDLPVLEGLYFINENTGWLVGDIVAMKTTNGGLSFIDSMRVEAIAQDVYFKDSLNGLFCSYSGGINKTTNGGKTWNRIQVLKPGPLYNFYRISVFNDSLVWVGSRPVYRSIDFGQTWDSISSYPFPQQGDYVYNISFSSPMTGYACGRSLVIYKTTDGGFNWQQQPTSESVPRLYLGMFAYSDSLAWTCGRKLILNTINGGLTGINNFTLEQPDGYKLYQNFPNPFNPETNIEFSIPTSSKVSLKIFDIQGKVVNTLLADKFLPSGNHSIKFNARELPSGIYFYRIESEDVSITKKMTLLK